MQRFLPTERYLKMWKPQQVPLFKYLYCLPQDVQMPRILKNQGHSLELIFVAEGFAKYILEGKEYAVQKGEVLVVNAHQDLDEFIVEEQNAVRYILGLDQVLIPGLDENCLIPEGKSPLIASQEFYDLLLSFFSLIPQLQEDTDLHAEILGYQVKSLFLIFNKLFGESESKEEDNQQVEIPLAVLIKDYIDRHFTEDLSLDSLSKRFNISSFYLSHMYKKQFNYSPVQYILRKRMSLAQTLLITTNLSIGEVAQKAGYKNPSHFHLLFTKNVGISPRKYRMNYEM